MGKTSNTILFGRPRPRRIGVVAAVALAILAYASAPLVIDTVGHLVGEWWHYAVAPLLFATVYAYHEDGLAVCWLLAGLPTFAAVVRLQLGAWFGPPTFSELVYAGLLFGGGVAVFAGTAGFILGVALRITRGEIAS